MLKLWSLLVSVCFSFMTKSILVVGLCGHPRGKLQGGIRRYFGDTMSGEGYKVGDNYTTSIM